MIQAPLKPAMLLVALVVFASPMAHASERMARNVLRPAVPVTLARGRSPTHVILKFVDETPIRQIEGQLSSSGPPPADLATIEALLRDTHVSRLFTRPVADLDQERVELTGRVPGDRPLPTDLNQYYRVTTSGPEQTVALIEALLEQPSVETAYAEATPVPLVSDIAPPTPLFESGQGYLGPAPLGLAHDGVRTLVGVRAPDVTIYHLEASWHFAHEDASQMVLASMVGDPPLPFLESWKDHSSAVAGILTADRNAYGLRGMSDAATLRLASIQYGTADMISTCTALAQPGDVFITSAAPIVQGQFYAPLDYDQAEFDAIYAAALKGVVYCFGSGNSGKDLGDASIYGTRYQPGAADSGGVIVGAGESTSLDASSFSNYGERVDCHAWGDGIWTLGYGTLFNVGDPKQLYASDFNGTSGSGPQIAGVAAAISNAVREQDGVQLDPFQIRELLRTVGTPQGAGGHVGPRPDLEQILASQGLPDGLAIPADAEIGQPASLELSGTPLSPVWLLASFARGRVDVGLNRDVLLDPDNLVVIPNVQLDASGQFTLTAVIPNQVALLGVSVYIQAVEWAPVTHLSSCSELWVRD